MLVCTCTLLHIVKLNSGSGQHFSLLLTSLTSDIKYNGLGDMSKLKFNYDSELKRFT